MMLHRFTTSITDIPLPERFTYPFCYTPHPLCILAAKEVQSYLTRQTAWKDELRQGKMFGVNVITAFKCGGKLLSTLHHSSGYLNMLSGRRGQVDVDYWTEENTNAKYPKPGGIQSGDNPKYGSTLGYFDASYWKVRTITLGYNMDNQRWLKQLGVQGLRAYVTIQNPFVICSPFHKETGLDPETNSYGDENVAVVGFQRRFLTVGTNSPSTRNYLFGINLTF